MKGLTSFWLVVMFCVFMALMAYLAKADAEELAFDNGVCGCYDQSVVRDLAGAVTTAHPSKITTIITLYMNRGLCEWVSPGEKLIALDREGGMTQVKRISNESIIWIVGHTNT